MVPTFSFFFFLLRTASSDLKTNLKNMLGFNKKIKIKLKKPFRVSKLLSIIHKCTKNL